MTLNHDSPASIRKFLEERDIAPRKRWGQNFLVNANVRKKIIALLDIDSSDRIWEIGPGLGAMSREILQLSENLTLFEIEPAFCLLLETYSGFRGFNLIRGDVVKTWKEEWKRKQPDMILGNLPYNTASAIIMAFLENGFMAKRSVFILQEEMSLRMMCKAGSKLYAPLSILSQIYSRISAMEAISPSSFYPAPRVRSRIVLMESSRPYGEIQSPRLLKIIVGSLFASRRKTLSNNLKSAVQIPGFPSKDSVQEAFRERGIDLSRRPETVSAEDWAHIANRLCERIQLSI